jgi:hypothetical protein
VLQDVEDTVRRLSSTTDLARLFENTYRHATPSPPRSPPIRPARQDGIFLSSALQSPYVVELKLSLRIHLARKTHAQSVEKSIAGLALRQCPRDKGPMAIWARRKKPTVLATYHRVVRCPRVMTAKQLCIRLSLSSILLLPTRISLGSLIP